MKSEIIYELKKHLPFTLTASLIAVLIAFFGILIYKTEFVSITLSLFWIFHPTHILFSSIVSAAIFYKYYKGFFMALIIGVLASITIGSISDVIFPYFGSLLFSITSFHLPLIENPALIFLVSIIGALIGLYFSKTRFPHLIHVLISTFASLFYVIAFGSLSGILSYILLFIVVFVSVVVPCCTSDIIFPLLCYKGCKKTL